MKKTTALLKTVITVGVFCCVHTLPHTSFAAGDVTGARLNVGTNHTLTPTATYSSIAGGMNNTVTNYNSAVGGGTNNYIGAFEAVIGGGRDNYIEKAKHTDIAGG